MSIHDADLKMRLTRFLDRKQAPRHIASETAVADEIAALIAAVRSRAPRDPDRLRDWWQAFETALEERCGRYWPTVQDIGNTAKALAPPPSSGIAEPGEIDSAAYAAARMNAGAAVGDGWLYGVLACELIARRLVDQDTMARYRSRAFLARRLVHGEDAAQAWEAEAKARHEGARDVWKSREAAREQRRLEIPRNQMPRSAA